MMSRGKPSTGARWARAVFSRHPWAIGLLEFRARHSSSRRSAYFDVTVGVLRRAGFSNQSAMRDSAMLDAYIDGYVVQEHSLAFRDDKGLQQVGESRECAHVRNRSYAACCHCASYSAGLP